jgi:hypothetical protein
MLVLRGHPVSIMVMFAIALHLWWALMIALDPSALNATGLSSLYRYIHSPQLLVLVVAGAALMAVAGMFARAPWMVMLLLPQQVLLMMSAAGVIEAIWLAQFADGVVRPRAFIAADQMYSVLAAVGHTLAIISRAINGPVR